MPHPRQWIEIRPEGIYCIPGKFYIDPMKPVHSAVVTHGHADHARAGHTEVYATPATLDIMDCRYGTEFAVNRHPVDYHESVTQNDVKITLVPAGHILGSAQAHLEYQGSSIVFSGDYKRRQDPTCEPFFPIHADVFVTEATFGLPVFRHPPIETEMAKLLASLEQFPHRAHLVGAYALGKCQRVILGLREAGYERPIYLHGAMVRLCELYERHGIALGPLIPVADKDRKDMAGEIVICPPSALTDRWASKMPDPVTALASGWMLIRARAKQKGVELPLIISDHADWDELKQSLTDVGAPEIWVTHGREEALVHYATQMGYKAQALSLLGYEEDESE